MIRILTVATFYSEASPQLCSPSVFVAIGIVFLFLSANPAYYFARVGETVNVPCVFNWKLESADRLRCFRDNASGELSEPFPGECGDPGSQCRITRTVESNRVTLTIRDTQRNDSGRYYCAERSGSSLRFSNASVVIVSGADSSVNPSVSILAPLAVSGSALDSKATLTLVCLIRGLSSLSVRVWWFISGNLVAEGTPSSGIKVKEGGEGQGDRESYTATSRLTIPVETWRNGAECACEAQLDRNISIRSGNVSYDGIHGAGLVAERCLVQYAVFSGVSLLALSAALCGCALWTRRRFKTASTEDSTRVTHKRTPGSGDTKRRGEEGSLVTYASLDFESQKKNRKKRRI
ncbi:M1-specific T cell receptor beta chain-like [Acipenser ruthenus]|uniref:M1-specific T cell receptor beta chain-like n=1 Tax=Acipenser ruthenus TaxID=7906 RepID=UPI0027421D83|nr:M1-specific T cell receptor beta chain-like [Acipenser ruthenus]